MSGMGVVKSGVAQNPIPQYLEVQPTTPSGSCPEGQESRFRISGLGCLAAEREKLFLLNPKPGILK